MTGRSRSTPGINSTQVSHPASRPSCVRDAKDASVSPQQPYYAVPPVPSSDPSDAPRAMPYSTAHLLRTPGAVAFPT